MQEAENQGWLIHLIPAEPVLTLAQCDEVKPSCRKCILSGWKFPGYQSRLNFQNEGTALKRKYGTRKIHGPFARHATLAALGFLKNTTESIETYSFPLSSSTKLASCFCQLLDFSLSTSLNLAAFGKFMTEVPMHIGLSKVLDRSVESLYMAHGALTSNRRELTVRSQMLYGQALQTLQRFLNSKEAARASETLCATIILAICEVSNPRTW